MISIVKLPTLHAERVDKTMKRMKPILCTILFYIPPKIDHTKLYGIYANLESTFKNRGNGLLTYSLHSGRKIRFYKKEDAQKPKRSRLHNYYMPFET